MAGWPQKGWLVALEETAGRSLLQGLARYFDSQWLPQGTYHTLHALERELLLDENGLQVLSALRSIQPEISAAWAVEYALENILK